MISILLNDIRNFTRDRDHKIPENQMVDVLEDIIQDIFEWLSIVSGLVYYNIKDGLGDDEIVNDILDSLLNILGYEKHIDLFDKKNI